MFLCICLCQCVLVCAHVTCEHVWYGGLTVSLGVCLRMSVHMKGVNSQARFGMQN